MEETMRKVKRQAREELTAGELKSLDMVVRNDLDRYRLVMNVIDRVPGLGVRAVAVRQAMADARTRHHAWIREHGTDLPEVAEWSWAQ